MASSTDDVEAASTQPLTTAADSHMSDGRATPACSSQTAAGPHPLAAEATAAIVMNTPAEATSEPAVAEPVPQHVITFTECDSLQSAPVHAGHACWPCTCRTLHMELQCRLQNAAAMLIWLGFAGSCWVPSGQLPAAAQGLLRRPVWRSSQRRRRPHARQPPWAAPPPAS
jgi:hypothetical protein